MSTAEMIRTEPRLLANLVQRRPAGLAAHLERHGPLPVSGASRPEFTRSFLVEVERSGLTGRGGAGFPTATKLHLERTKRAHPVLLANAMEGEPASAKDRLLLESAPHLVLDGAELAALALNGGRIVLCLPAERRDLSERLVAAVEARRRSGYSAAPIEIALLAGHYVAGEESALAPAVGEGVGLPQFRPDKSVPLTIGRRPVLVHNVETLAHLGLIARHGADWFRRWPTRACARWPRGPRSGRSSPRPRPSVRFRRCSSAASAVPGSRGGTSPRRTRRASSLGYARRWVQGC